MPALFSGLLPKSWRSGTCGGDFWLTPFLTNRKYFHPKFFRLTAVPQTRTTLASYLRCLYFSRENTLSDFKKEICRGQIFCFFLFILSQPNTELQHTFSPCETSRFQMLNKKKLHLSVGSAKPARELPPSTVPSSNYCSAENVNLENPLKNLLQFLKLSKNKIIPQQLTKIRRNKI